MSKTISPIRVRSGFSPAGTAMPGRLVELAAAGGHAHLALTDVNCLAGAPAFYRAAEEAGLRPIVGAELVEGPLSAVALIAEEAGYSNLCQLITRRHGTDLPTEPTTNNDGEKPAHSDGPALRAGSSEIPHLLGDMGELQEGLHFVVEDAATARRLAGVIDRRRLWMGIDPAIETSRRLRELTACAEELHLPLTAVGTALLAEAGDMELARLLAAIRRGKTFDTVRPEDLPHPKSYLRRGEELAGPLADFPRAAGNNRRLCEICGEFRLLPREPVFPRFVPPRGEEPGEYLRRLCRVGLRTRYGHTPPDGADTRMEKELRLIERKGFCEYFLVVWDIVRYARRRGAPVAGRGSGASSLAAYLLGITNVCPLRYKIPFERFLHEERQDFPDLDIDFCWRIRDDVIEYTMRRWGAGHAAMVCTHNAFQDRSALREAAKAFGFSDEQISRSEVLDDDGRIATIARLSRRLVGLPHNFSVHPGGVVMGALPIDHYAPVQPAPKGVNIIQYDKDGAEAMGLVKLDLLGNRNLSTVSAACEMISRRGGRLNTARPLGAATNAAQNAPPGLHGNKEKRRSFLCCHSSLAEPGIVLGEGNERERGRSLPFVGPAEHFGNRTRSVSDIEAIPPDDPATVRMLQEADTVGCNQLESPAMRHLLRMMQPAGVADVMQALAMIRPGAAGIGMKETFIRRRRGLEKAPPRPTAVAGLLADTHGVMLYEDDVMLAAAALTGGTLGEADRFRKAIQKCATDAQRLALSKEFLARCRESGADLDCAKDLWVQMAKFNAYSFCRAHAASYASIAYAGAYLKAHWPLEFWTAALNNNQGMYPPRVYVEHAKRDGIRFLLPDVNRSEAEFALEDGSSMGILPMRRTAVSAVQETENCRGKMPLPRMGGTPMPHAIRVGLGLVEGLGPVAVADILRQRERGPFAGLSDFLLRTGLGEAEARSLVLCGALDWTGRSRPTLMMELNLFVRIGPRPLRGRDGRTERSSPLLAAVPVIPNVPGDYDYERKYRDERAILGISVREHIVAFHRARKAALAEAVDADSRDVPARVGRTIRLAGVIEARRSTPTQRGGEMLFLTMEDEWGLMEVSVFPDTYRRLRSRLDHYGPYVVSGTVEDQYGAITIAADDVQFLDQQPEGPSMVRTYAMSKCPSAQ